MVELSCQKELKKINRLISKIVIALQADNIILEEDSDIYSYGLEILISNLTLLISILIVGMICGKLQYTLLFLMVFIGLRRVTGGYHTKKRWQCFCLTNALHSIIIGFTVLDYTYIMDELVFICVIFSVGIVYVAAPIENKDNPKTPREIVKNRVISRVAVSVLGIITLVGFYGGESYKQICSTIAITMTLVGILILLPYMKEW